MSLGEGEDFLVQKFNRRMEVELCTNVQSKPFCPAFGIALLAVARLIAYWLVVKILKLKVCFVLSNKIEI